MGSNVSDVIIQLVDVRKESAIRQDGIGKLLWGLTDQYGRRVAPSQAKDQGTDKLAQCAVDLSTVIAMGARGNSDIETPNLTMGLVASQVQVRSDTRNL